MIVYEFTVYYNRLGLRATKKIYVLAKNMEYAIEKYNSKYPNYYSYEITGQHKIDVF